MALLLQGSRRRRVHVAVIRYKYQKLGPRYELKKESARVQDGPYADTKEQLGGFTVLELPRLTPHSIGQRRCPAASYGAVEVRPLAPDMKRRVENDCSR